MSAPSPIVVELVRSRLVSTTREMSERLKRAAYSPMIRETLDFCSALHDPTGAVVAQSTGIPGLFGLMSHAMRAALERHPLETLEPGDVLISNDPYEAGGLHLNDVNVMAPVFHDGEVVLLAQSKAHWVDIGSIEAGGWSPDATDLQQEGLRMPPLRLIRAGRWNEDVLALIEANVRLPTQIRGDLNAQVGSTRAAVVRVQELLARHGRPVVDACMATMLDQADAAMRARIAELPDGVYRAVDYADPESGSDDPIRVEVALTVQGDRLIADFAGSAPQGATAFGNCAATGTEAFTRLMAKSVLDPLGPTTEGSYRAIEVRTQPGSCVSPAAPAPVTVGPCNVGHAVLECVGRALAQVVPERCVGDQFGSVQVLVIAGQEVRATEPFIFFTSGYGGGGARATRDGLNGVATQIDGDVQNMPVEVIESNLPLRVERFELRADSGGPGRQRGGLGVRADYRLLADQATGSIALNRAQVAPRGVLGGEAPLLSQMVIDPDAADARSQWRGPFALDNGQVVSHQIGGGAGYGLAWERDPSAVAADVRDGYVSASAAREAYGTVVDDAGAVDAEATARLRASGRRVVEVGT